MTGIEARTQGQNQVGIRTWPCPGDHTLIQSWLRNTCPHSMGQGGFLYFTFGIALLAFFGQLNVRGWPMIKDLKSIYTIGLALQRSTSSRRTCPGEPSGPGGGREASKAESLRLGCPSQAQAESTNTHRLLV